MQNGRNLNRRDILSGALGVATIAPSFASGARAQGAAYPDGIIKAICPFPPGSGADVKIRFYSNKLAEKLNATVIVENRPGALGYIATEYVARSKPDGLTIYIAPGSSMLASAPYFFKTLKFDPINDFEHIALLSFSAFVMCVSSAKPIYSVAELTEYLRKKGPSASYGSVAPTSIAFGETYKLRFGLEAENVKYKEQGQLIIDLINGSLDFTCIDIITVAGLIKDGQLRPLAMSSAERLKSVPDIPGAAEAGIPGLDIKNWWSVHVPAKTPKPICDRLEAVFGEIAVEPDTLKFLTDNGSDPMVGDAKATRELLIKDTESWREYARIARIEPI